MVLPGLQALFGFQLIAIFNQNFSERLSHAEQQLHLVAIGLSIICVGMVMGPASYHRQTGPMEVTSHFMRVASNLLLWSMFPLAMSLCIDVYIVSHLIVEHEMALAVSLMSFVFLIGIWYVLPRSRRLQSLISR